MNQHAPTSHDRRRPVRILFACVGNSGRSQMAEAWARHLGGERVLVKSGGSVPAEAVSSKAVAAMAERGVFMAGAHPKPIDAAFAREADAVVTMGCGEDACPVFHEREVLDWPLEDPKDLDLDGVRRVRDEIEARVRGLLLELGVLDE